MAYNMFSAVVTLPSIHQQAPSIIDKQGGLIIYILAAKNVIKSHTLGNNATWINSGSTANLLALSFILSETIVPDNGVSHDDDMVDYDSMVGQ